MKLNKLITIAIFSVVFASQCIAETTAATIINNTPYTVEFSQMIGGYAENTPLLSHEKTKILPDPGSHIIRGHLMLFNSKIAGRYVDNIIFISQAKNDKWKFTKIIDLYGKVDIKTVKAQTVLM